MIEEIREELREGRGYRTGEERGEERGDERKEGQNEIGEGGCLEGTDCSPSAYRTTTHWRLPRHPP